MFYHVFTHIHPPLVSVNNQLFFVFVFFFRNLGKMLGSMILSSLLKDNQEKE